MAAIDGTKLVIIIDSSDEEESEKNGRSCKIAAQSSNQNPRNKEEKNNGDIARSDGVSCNNYVYRSKAEEYKILADLSPFPQLAAMFAFEARISKKSRKRNQKKRRNKMQKLESQSPKPIIDKAGKGDVAVLDERSVILSANDMPQKLLEVEKMVANEYSKLEKLVVLLDTNGSKPLKNDTTSDKSTTPLSEAPKKESRKEVQEDKNGGRNSKDIRFGGDINGNNYVYRTKVEEYKMLADLSEFPQLAAMFAFEARVKKKKREKEELVAPISNNDETSETAEVLDATPAVISEKGITQKLFVDGPDDNSQGKAHKALETTEEINVDNGIRSAIVIDDGLPFLEGSEGHEENAGLRNLEGLVETEQTEALVREEQKIFEERDYTNIVVEVGKHADSTKDAETMTSLKVESVERKQNFALRKLLRSPRYFDFPISSWQMCYSHGKDDHSAVECTMERKKKPCYICGGLEHSAKHCKQRRNCFKCNRRGHFARDCLEKDPSSNETSDICLKCCDLGHDMFSCYNEYSPDDLKKIQCSVCEEFGHLCCVDFVHEGPKIVTCYKCGQNGHLGSGCTKLLRDTKGRRANSFCRKCKVKGHFARECRE